MQSVNQSKFKTPHRIISKCGFQVNVLIMTDSPSLQASLDPVEEPILCNILHLRDELSFLKQDKSTYIRSHDVLHLYNQLLEQIHHLNVVRQEHGKPLEQNRGRITYPPSNCIDFQPNKNDRRLQLNSFSLS